MLKRLLTSTILLTAIASSTYAIDAVTLSYGQGTPENVRTGLVGVQWTNWPGSYSFGDGWKVSGLADVQVGYWNGNAGSNNSLMTFAGMPMVRLQKTLPSSNLIPYVDGGIGLGFYTQDQLGPNQLGSSWGFENKVGTGFLFGNNHQYDLSYHYVYFGNYGLYSKNDGFAADWMLTFAYHFD